MRKGREREDSAGKAKGEEGRGEEGRGGEEREEEGGMGGGKGGKGRKGVHFPQEKPRAARIGVRRSLSRFALHEVLKVTKNRLLKIIGQLYNFVPRRGCALLWVA